MTNTYSERFIKFLPLILKYEGGYVNHPNDPGGETYSGVARKAHPNSELWKIVDEYKKRVSNVNTAEGIRQINTLLSNDSRVKNIVQSIYHTYYWAAIQADAMPYPIGEYICDFGINAGISRATTMLQRVLGIQQDGRITQTVLNALKNKNVEEIMYKLYVERVNYYTQITLARPQQFNVFLLGWIRRTNEMFSTLMNKK